MTATVLTPGPCACGCGQTTRIREGKLQRYVHGHNRRRDFSKRFWEKVTTPNGPSGCWMWAAAKSPGGYGLFTPSPSGTRQAHRIAYELAVGPIPEGMHMDHLCLTTSCVNPYHLEAVTPAENVSRGGRSFGRRMTECMRGHDWTNPNNYAVRPTGWRYCKACRRKEARDA